MSARVAIASEMSDSCAKYLAFRSRLMVWTLFVRNLSRLARFAAASTCWAAISGDSLSRQKASAANTRVATGIRFHRAEGRSGIRGILSHRSARVGLPATEDAAGGSIYSRQ